jgi:CubicO group peptidase (beta-lactamase class C family)
MKKTVIALFAFMISAGSFAQGDARMRKIDSLMNYLTENNKFMGSVILRENNKTVFQKAYGYADADNKIKADVNTKYKIGSITKMFTSAIIFQLIEEKKLTLDTKLSKYYPQIKNADKITIAQLLQHKSGIFNYTNDASFREVLTTQHGKNGMLTRLAGFEPYFEPGTRAEYSNSNYLLLGYIIEDVTKKPYKDNVAERIAKKAGLKDTYYYTKIDPKRNEAISYKYNGTDWVKEEEWDESVAAAAGALQSTPADLAKFIEALYDGKIISKKSLEEMMTFDAGYGKGILQFPFGERKFIGHNGSIEGFSSTLGYYPKEDVTFSLIQNGDNYDTNDIILGVLSIYYKMPYQFPNVKTVDVDPAILRTYAGTYSSAAIPLKVMLKEENGKLIAQATGQSPFAMNAVSNTEFSFDPAGIVLLMKKDGFTLKQGGMVMEFTREK